MGKAPAFQFYANDFMDATSTWEANACGLYVRCLCKQWTHGSIPSDLRILARAIHSDREELESCWDVLGPKFVDQGDGTLKNRKLEEVRERQKEVSDKRSEAGKLGAIAKANAYANGQAKPTQRKVKEKEEIEVEEGHEVTWAEWAGQKVMLTWAEFKEYRWTTHKVKYKSPTTEQHAVNLLAKYYTTGRQCVDGLNLAMAKGWKFPVDPKDLAPKQANGKPVETQSPTAKPWIQ